MRLFKSLFCLCSFFLFSGLVAERLLWFASLEQAGATDSYYYLQDFKHFLSTGRGYYSAYSPFLLLSGSLGSLLSLNEVQILFAVATTSLLLLSVALCLPALFRKEAYLLPALASLPWLSDIVFFRAYAFARQSLSLSVLLFTLSLFFSTFRPASKAPPQKIAIFCLILGLLAASLHVLGAALFAFALVFLPTLKHRTRGALLFALLLGVLLYAGENSKSLFAFEGFSLFRFFDGACLDFHCSAFELAEFRLMSFCLLLLLLLGLRLTKVKQPFFYYCLTTALVLNLPIWHQSSGLSQRLSLVSFSFLLCCLSLSPYLYKEIIFPRLLLGLSFASYLLLAITLPHNPYRVVHPSISALQRHSLSLQSLLPKNSFVLAPHGLQFAVSYFSQRASAKTLPLHSSFSPIYKLKSASPAPAHCQAITLQSAENRASCISLDENVYLIEQ